MAVAMVESTRPVTGAWIRTWTAMLGRHWTPMAVSWVSSRSPGYSGWYASLSSWLAGFEPVDRVGVEGTGAYGAGLARHLRSLGVEVIEVDRPNRQLRRAQGKSDSLDAIEAVRAVLSGRATGVATTADGNVEAMRALLIVTRSGRRITCLNQIRHLGFSAPDSCGNGSGPLRARRWPPRPPPRVPDPTATRCSTPRSSRCAAPADACSPLTTRSPRSMPPSPSSSPPRLRLCSACSASLSTPPPSSASPPATIPSESAAKPLGRSCAVSHPSRQPPARPPAATSSTGAGAARRTMRSGHRVHPSRRRCPHPQLRRPPPRRRPQPPRDHPHPQLRRPRDLPTPPTLTICSGGPGPLTA
jgi:hypothetical protein